MNKIYPDAAAALAGVVQNGQTIAVGGFGLCGIPEALIGALRDSGVTGLTAISRKRLSPSNAAGAKSSRTLKIPFVTGTARRVRVPIGEPPDNTE